MSNLSHLTNEELISHLENMNVLDPLVLELLVRLKEAIETN